MFYWSDFDEIKIYYRSHIEVFKPAPRPPTQRHKSKDFENFLEFFSSSIFQKNKNDKNALNEHVYEVIVPGPSSTSVGESFEMKKVSKF